MMDQSGELQQSAEEGFFPANPGPAGILGRQGRHQNRSPIHRTTVFPCFASQNPACPAIRFAQLSGLPSHRFIGTELHPELHPDSAQPKPGKNHRQGKFSAVEPCTSLTLLAMIDTGRKTTRFHLGHIGPSRGRIVTDLRVDPRKRTAVLGEEWDASLEHRVRFLRSTSSHPDLNPGARSGFRLSPELFFLPTDSRAF